MQLQFQMLSNASQQNKGAANAQGVHGGPLSSNQALHLSRRSPSLVTKPPLAPPTQQPNLQRGNLMKPSFQVRFCLPGFQSSHHVKERVSKLSLLLLGAHDIGSKCCTPCTKYKPWLCCKHTLKCKMMSSFLPIGRGIRNLWLSLWHWAYMSVRLSLFLQGAMEIAAQGNKAGINGGLASMPAVQSGFAMGNNSHQAAAMQQQQQVVLHPSTFC